MMSRSRIAPSVLALGAAAGLASSWALAQDRPAPATLQPVVERAVLVADAPDAPRYQAPIIEAISPTAIYLATGTIDTSPPRGGLSAVAGPVSAGTWYLIQLDGPITPARRDAIEAAGIALGDYLPSHAYIARLDAADPRAVARLEFIRWWSVYSPGWKLSPALGAGVGPSVAGGDGVAKRQVLVTIFAGGDLNATSRAMWQIPGTDTLWEEPLAGGWQVAVQIRQEAIPELAGIADIQFVEPGWETSTRNSTNRWIVQSNLPGVFPFYNRGLRGEGQIVGVLDGRVAQTHCSFADSTGTPIGPSHRKIVFYSGVAGSDQHGTHVAGTAVGDAGADNDTRGIAYAGKLAFGPIPGFSESSVLSALNANSTAGARVHTNSWGNDSTTAYDGLARGFDVFMYNNEDSLVTLAVSNGSRVTNPENAKNLLGVGASQDSPSQGSHCSGGTGPTADGRRKPEIYAPGCGTISSSGTACATAGLTGTSMATPAVAGAPLLARQYFTAGFYPGGTAGSGSPITPSGALIKAALINSAVDMTGVAGYPSNLEGWGRVLLDNAFFFAGDTRTMLVSDVRNANGLSTGQQTDVPIQVLGSSEQLRVTLAYTEPPAAAGAGVATVNDLDLELVSPSGQVFLGNNFVGGVSATGGAKDARNNLEQAHINAPAIGTWTARIRGASVAVGRQGYALVATGAIQAGQPAPLRIVVPGTLPATIAPGTQETFTIDVIPGTQGVAAGSPALLYRARSTASFVSFPLASLGGTRYQVTLPAPACGDRPEYYFQARGTGGAAVTEPLGAPAGAYTAAVGLSTTLWADNFETDRGWTVTNDPSVTAGAWVRVRPTQGGFRGDPLSDADGSGQCFVTGNTTDEDLDGGPTTLTSPIINLAGASEAAVAYQRWMSNDDGDDSLIISVSNDGGATWRIVESILGGSGSWVARSFRLADFVAPTASVRLRVSVSDNPNNSVTEAGLDAVRITNFGCVSPPPPPPPPPPACFADCDRNSILDVRDFSCFQNAFALGDLSRADCDANGGLDVRDFTCFQNRFALGCP